MLSVPLAGNQQLLILPEHHTRKTASKALLKREAHNPDTTYKL